MEVLEITDNLKLSAVGRVDIGASLIKSVASAIVELLKYVFNISLHSGVVLKDLNIAHQNGFQKNHSADMALSQKKIYPATNNKYALGVLNKRRNAFRTTRSPVVFD